jgi:hypothetical protein
LVYEKKHVRGWEAWYKGFTYTAGIGDAINAGIGNFTGTMSIIENLFHLSTKVWYTDGPAAFFAFCNALLSYVFSAHEQGVKKTLSEFHRRRGEYPQKVSAAHADKSPSLFKKKSTKADTSEPKDSVITIEPALSYST